MTLPKLRYLLLIVVAMLGLAACGDDDNAAASDSTTSTATPAPIDDPAGQPSTFPVTVRADNGEVTIEARPEAIVSISSTATEMLFAIDAGDQVIAVDSLSNYPPDAPVTDLAAYETSAEAVASFDPDLVVLSYDPGGVVEGLHLLGIPTLLLDAAGELDDVYTQIELLGVATGQIAEAAELVATMQSDLEEIVANLPDHVEGLTYFHELDDLYYSVTSSTFIGRVYGLMGLVNIADAADPEGESFGYPQLSEEFIIQSDPDIVFLADGNCCGQSAETVAARPGWDGIAAVQNGAVFVVDEDLASRWGPRIIDFVAEVSHALTQLEPAS